RKDRVVAHAFDERPEMLLALAQRLVRALGLRHLAVEPEEDGEEDADADRDCSAATGSPWRRATTPSSHPACSATSASTPRRATAPRSPTSPKSASAGSRAPRALAYTSRSSERPVSA